MMLRSALLSLFFVTAAVTANTTNTANAGVEAIFPPPAIILEDNSGGTVATFEYFYDAIKLSGIPVRVRGVCESACTWVMTLPAEQWCLEKTGVLGFHFLTAGAGGRILKEVSRSVMTRKFPKALLDHLATLPSDPRYHNPLFYVDQPKLIELGVARACENDPHD